MATFLERTGPNNPLDGVDVGGWSAPTFADIDTVPDGDLDAIVGTEDGLGYYENINGTFTGMVYNSSNSNLRVGKVSSPTFADIDKDGDLDQFVGSSDGLIRYYRNDGGFYKMATFNEQSFENPLGAYIDVGYNASPTFADIDSDGDLDAFIGERLGTIRYYRNDGGPFFNEQTGTSNPLNGVNVGFASAPTFADLDEDGDLDAFIGAGDGTVRYYRNDDGTFSEQIGTNNPLNVVDVGFHSKPTFADLDKDGDLDAFIGADDGTIRYYENSQVVSIAAGTTPSEAEPAAPITGNFVVTLSQAAATDLIISYTVAGTATAGGDYTALPGTVTIAAGQTSANIDVTPILDSITDPGESVQVTLTSTASANYELGATTTATLTITDQLPKTFTKTGELRLNVPYFSSPTLADIDLDGDLDIFIGAGDGTIRYGRFDGNSYIEQTGTTNPFNSVDVGDDSSPTFADIDGDGDLDAVIGARDGILSYYRNDGGVLLPKPAPVTPLAA